MNRVALAAGFIALCGCVAEPPPESESLARLLEHGLRVHLRNLEETGLSRELAVGSDPDLAELIRRTGIPKYRTPHEAGWLASQFHGPFERTGWSSFQVYLWARERPVFDDCPNREALLALLRQIDSSPAAKIGGNGVCHYGCQ